MIQESNQNRQVGDISGHDDHGGRTGTSWTVTAHIITAMAGTGVLSLAWDISQLGWIAGPTVMLLFSFMSYYTSRLLADCYHSGDVVSRKRNHTYTDSVHSILGGAKAKACGFIQYLVLFGHASHMTIEASVSMMAIKSMNCSHESKGENGCNVLSNPYMILFGITEILVSLIPNFDQIWWISMACTVMSFTFYLIAIGLGIAQVAANGSSKSGLSNDISKCEHETPTIWTSFEAAGHIASVYSFSDILIEIQDTIRSPPSEATTTMKKAITRSTVVLTTIYMLYGCIGYSAFGHITAKNFLIGCGLDKPFWLLDLANAAIVIFLVGAYRLYCQPIFAFVEKQAGQRWPDNEFIAKERKIPVPGLGQYKMNLFRLVWRTIFVILTTVISMLFPSFNDVVEIITLGFWPLAVYFPVEMYIIQRKFSKWSTKWVCLQMLSMACLVISIVVTAGSIAGLKHDLKDYQPFNLWYY